MTLEETTQLYASVLRQLLPTGGYDTSPNTEALAVDVYAHAKLLAQADLDAKRLLRILEELPSELLPEYEAEYGLPMQCMVPGSQTIEERISVLRWIRQHRNVMNREYLEQILAIFGVALLELKKYKPMQCTAPCNSAVNTEQLRYKVQIVIPNNAPADLNCIIDNYLPGYLRVDVSRTPLLFKTSKPYPVEVDTSVKTQFTVLNPVLQKVYESTGFDEELNTHFTVLNPVRVESVRYSSKSIDPELLQTEFRVLSPVRVDSVKYSSTALDIESLKTQFTVSNAKVETLLISQSIDIESLKTQFTVLNPVRGG